MKIKTQLTTMLIIFLVTLAAISTYFASAYINTNRNLESASAAVTDLLHALEVRANVNRQLKEVTDYHLQREERDLEEFHAYGEVTQNSIDRWSESLERAVADGIEEESELTRIKALSFAYKNVTDLTTATFSMVGTLKLDAPLDTLSQSINPTIERTLFTPLDQIIDDEIAELDEAYTQIISATGLSPWIANTAISLTETSRAALNDFITMDEARNIIVRQIKAGMDYLLSGNEADKATYIRLGVHAEDNLKSWREALEYSLSIDVENEDEDLRRAESATRAYIEIRQLLEDSFRLMETTSRAVALDTLETQMEPIVDDRLIPIFREGVADELLEIRLAHEALNRTVTFGVTVGLIVTLSISALAIFIFVRIVRGLLRSLGQVTTAVHAISKGNLEHRIDLGLNDEIGQVADAFDDMADKLLASETAQRNANLLLEQRVQDRTAELTQTTHRMQNEIVARYAAEQTALAAQSQAEVANHAKSTFLINMSHEIRTPLNGVSGFTEMLMLTPLDKVQAEYASMIEQSSKTLLLLINDMLDLSKIEEGEFELESSEFDPEKIAYDVCDQLIQKTHGKPTELLCRVDRDFPAILLGDPLRFRQVLTNLVGNACKFTPSGEIELTLGKGHEDGDRVELHIRIRDTGIGVPAEKLQTIFRPFEQADNSVTRKYGGTGLGLAISKKIASLMGGDIRIESRVGEGSTFHFTAWFTKTKDSAPRPAINHEFTGKRILVVGSSPSNRQIITTMLESFGATTLPLPEVSMVVATLTEAANTHQPYDCLILDITSAGEGFRSAVADIRCAGGIAKDIPILVAASLPERTSQSLDDISIDGFLTKPIRRDNLQQMLSGLQKDPTVLVKDKLQSMGADTQPICTDGPNNSARILLAEDNLINQKLARAMLIKTGYSVVIANNGDEAVDIFTASPDSFGAILMDVQMPIMDGITATRTLRAQGYSDIPIIAMTANSMKGDRKKCIDAGMNDYMPKPINMANVSKVVGHWVRKSALGSVTS